jgi:hypothetical protein
MQCGTNNYSPGCATSPCSHFVSSLQILESFHLCILVAIDVHSQLLRRECHVAIGIEGFRTKGCVTHVVGRLGAIVHGRQSLQQLRQITAEVCCRVALSNPSKHLLAIGIVAVIQVTGKRVSFVSVSLPVATECFATIKVLNQKKRIKAYKVVPAMMKASETVG